LELYAASICPPCPIMSPIKIRDNESWLKRAGNVRKKTKKMLITFM